MIKTDAEMTPKMILVVTKTTAVVTKIVVVVTTGTVVVTKTPVGVKNKKAAFFNAA